MSLISVWRRTIEKADKNKTKNICLKSLESYKVVKKYRSGFGEGQVWRNEPRFGGYFPKELFADSGDGSWETSRDEAQWTTGVLTGYALGVKVYPVRGPCRHYSSGLQPPEGLTWQHQGLAKTGSDRNFQAWLMGLQIGSLNLENTFALCTKVEDMYSLGAFNSIPR